MNIGQAARQTGVSAKMIRYYEQSGLIPPAGRSEAGYREYTEADIHMLRFIRRARDLGFSMSEISELLDLWQDKSRHSAEVKRIARAHIEDLNARIRNLQEMANTLSTLADSCHGDDRPECPIIERLETGGPDQTVRPRGEMRRAPF